MTSKAIEGIRRYLEPNGTFYELDTFMEWARTDLPLLLAVAKAASVHLSYLQAAGFNISDWQLEQALQALEAQWSGAEK